jgi:aryl-alcohol dehydrogenase-like predicted oxidoreductase
LDAPARAADDRKQRPRRAKQEHTMRYTLLGQSGLRISELALGTMTFGTDWGWGASESESAKQFELFAEAGGTLIDTANRYTNGSAEAILGDLLAADRDHFVVGTKYSLNTRDGDLNAGGNHRKNLVRALEASLRRLRTDYVDVLWLHAWDYLTPAEEVMRALDDQVRLGKVLYLGISDTPAWVVAQLQTLAAARGWSTFAGLQIEYSLVQREVERELIPMARSLGLSILAWGPLGAGVLSGKYAGQGQRQDEQRQDEQRQDEQRQDEQRQDEQRPGQRRLPDPDPTRLAIARTVADVARELGLSSSVVALAWLRAQGGVIPILGARTAQQLADNLACLDTELPSAALTRLNEASHVARGFPHDFLASADFIFGGMSDRLDLPPGRSRHG